MNKRILHTLRLWTILSSSKRLAYIKKHNIFGAIGERCSIMDRKVPLYANLIHMGNNVHLASNVHFVTHDIIHVMLNLHPDLPYTHTHTHTTERFQEQVDCIDIRDNVFIGTQTTVLGGVRIGSNVIVAAGSLVNKDIPDNSVVAGVPARVVGSFSDFVEKKRNIERYPVQPVMGRYVPKELEDWLWERFSEKRKS